MRASRPNSVRVMKLYQIDPDLSTIKCYLRNDRLVPKCASSAPRAAIKMPAAAS